ncbi:cytochrome P450 [Gimesia sp.]|uniref:cytochrome P450 n=1 Tax=Gimesia sp. TaxID=2024833 RepID=UPI000C5BB33F|nr:cytochrome P450 [Gimesia sp.]MAX38264.1 cytochrome P450 [Gimesia sp.]HAH49001.1 cytochrome P450 [Planctomycetaceae bacterium]|tara:strand:- start:9703 stop:11001 length:1299 start_codon:yes stop_codon:yes gene_type:complete
MNPIPQLQKWDSTLDLLRDPYGFISRNCQNEQSDLFEARLLLQKTFCMRGQEAAQVFYDPDLFCRAGAAPRAVMKTLFGQGGVQGLDEDAHRHRKQMFLSIMTTEQIDHLEVLTERQLSAAVPRWKEMAEVPLYEEFQRALTIAVCDWAGVPLADSEVELRTRQLTSLFHDAAKIGMGHFRARMARRQTNAWITDLIKQIRAQEISLPAHSPASTIAWHRDLKNNLLEPQVAAVELLNLLRPVVAISVYMTLIAHALHFHPDCREKLKSGSDEYVRAFVQEVRRYYPFFPFTAAIVQTYFEWNGFEFPRGKRVLLDLYGTNHDGRIWKEPELFQPDRFSQREPTPYDFIPQGGGEYALNHRCPGEWITVSLMQLTSRFLTQKIHYEVRDQKLEIDFSQMPALPRDPFMISSVRAAGSQPVATSPSQPHRVRI